MIIEISNNSGVCVPITTLNDQELEQREMFVVSLVAALGPVLVSTNNIAVVAIKDTDSEHHFATVEPLIVDSIWKFSWSHSFTKIITN